MSLLKRVGKATVVALVAGTVGGAALLTAEAIMARRRSYAQPALGLNVRASIGADAAPPLRLVMLGDSAALGVGVDRVADTVGGQLAELLSNPVGGEPGRRVDLSSVGVSGSRSSDLATQVARALLGLRPDVAVILVGANDVIGLRSPGEAATHLGAAVRRLREAGVEVVVGTCPDMGAARAIAPPLRQIVGWLGRRIARAQIRAVHAAGGAIVDLGAETGPVFRADPATLCEDRYHPSADGYRVWAYALLPAVAHAAGVSPTLP
ncbi:MAG: SGNH/GDSL hydrolase family protein [Hamadaea sp.]|uniref:SGNH/GDSL hydrolase family protein n=1 Tax=Hamadaea sp. NPDC050747 TaxID=3155789 RepID=UPI0018344967|nr:SGNH/GDSL hydrolase family protein [Hamadaea sp.]NUR51125.1 SGNH/GDSL hydrolase family protein [Hamadaea sp.]NUT05753.1 SGNH/GDSL hydrolase family protein [Hamadaea sp.]